MDSIMDFLFPVFTICEDFLVTFTEITNSYGLTITCCLLWVAATLTILDAGLASLPAMTRSCRKEYRNHVNSLLQEVSDSPSSYGNCPIRLSQIGLEIEMRFGTPLNWEYANIDLLIGTSKSKKKSRKALLGDHWLTFVTAVPPAERTQLYKAAMGLQKAFDKLEADKLIEHQTLVEPLGFTVTGVRWNYQTQSWSYAYACKVVKRHQGDTNGDVDRFTLDQWVQNWDLQS